MKLEELLEKYIKATGSTSRLKSKYFRRPITQRGALRAFAAWADRQGYYLGQTKGDNGAAIFCATCGGYISEAAMSTKPKGEA